METLSKKNSPKPRAAKGKATTKTAIKQRLSPTVQKTLNGYDQAVALQMIANFAQYYQNDNNPKSVNAWYSLSDLTNIYNLLTSEAQDRATDGVRFYFGCNPPVPGITALSLSIFPVSTETRIPVGAQSNHGDYYDHTAAYLSNGPIGISVSNAAAASYSIGALLYGARVPNDAGCANPSQHYLDTPTVYTWVQRHCETSGTNDPSPLNTKAEWFPLCFITSLFYSIMNAPASAGFDGLRIYLGKGYVVNGTTRDVVILVPTITDGNGNHADYHGCLEDLLESTFCGDVSLTSNMGLKFPQRAGQIKSFRTAVRAKSFWEGGGYDEGELCPNSCN